MSWKYIAAMLAAGCVLHLPCRADDVPTEFEARGSESAQRQAGPEEVLRDFLQALSKGDVDRAYALVAPGTKLEGDPIAYGTKVDRNSLSNELGAHSAEKFRNYKVGKRRKEGKNRVRIFIHFAGGDNDETLLLQEGGRWYVADPVHIIR